MDDDIDRLLLQASVALVAGSLQNVRGRCLVVGPDDLAPEALDLGGADISILSSDDLDGLSDDRFDTVLAIDVLDHAAHPGQMIAALQQRLAADGSLTLIQPNRLLRRGLQPQAAGGPAQSLSYYETRSLFGRDAADLHAAAVILDGDLSVQPLALNTPSPSLSPVPSQAVAFAFCQGPAVSPFILHGSHPPQGLPTQARDLALVSPEIALGAVRRIAFVIDVHNWAFDNIVNHIGPGLAGRYEVTRFYIGDYDDRNELFLDLFVRNSFDNIHVMWREYIFNTLNARQMLLGAMQAERLTPAQLASRLADPVLTTTAYDHMFLTPDEVAERQPALALLDGYSVASGILKRLYHQNYDMPPDIETADGVNTAFFHNTAPRAFQAGQPVRIGWVGNSAWGSANAGVGDDPKGLHSILMPAIAQLQKQGVDVVLELADRNLRQRDREQMRDYYSNEIDILVCASAFEGTPNPVMEAMASGCPFVSTDVGIVREICGPLQAAFILPERSIEAMVEMLGRMIAQPQIVQALSQENLTHIAWVDWAARVDSWTQLFAKAETSHRTGRRQLRKEVMLSRLTAWEANARLQKSGGQSQAEAQQLREQLLRVRAAAEGHRNRIAVLMKTVDTLRADLVVRSEMLANLTRQKPQATRPDPATAPPAQVVTSDLDRLRQQYGALAERYDAMSEHNAALEYEIGQISAARTDTAGSHHATRVAELEDWVMEMQAELGRKDAWIEQMQVRIAELEAWSGQMQGQLQATRFSRITRTITSRLKGKS